MVATLVIHVITGITTHLPTPEGRKAELAWTRCTEWALVSAHTIVADIRATFSTERSWSFCNFWRAVETAWTWHRPLHSVSPVQQIYIHPAQTHPTSGRIGCRTFQISVPKHRLASQFIILSVTFIPLSFIDFYFSFIDFYSIFIDSNA